MAAALPRTPSFRAAVSDAPSKAVDETVVAAGRTHR